MHRLQTENRELQKFRGYMEKYNKMKEMLDEAMAKVICNVMKVRREGKIK